MRNLKENRICEACGKSFISKHFLLCETYCHDCAEGLDKLELKMGKEATDRFNRRTSGKG